MKLDHEFRRLLHREFQTRLLEGTLPPHMLRVLEARLPGPSAAVAASTMREGGEATPLGLDGGLAAAAAAGTEAALALRTVVNAFESPSLLVRNDTFELPSSDAWAAVLEEHRTRLEAMLPAVGRIEVLHHPTRRWLGTGVLVAAGVIVTNRHVALLMIEESAEGWRFAPGTGGRTIAASVDFGEEHDVPSTADFELVDVLSVEAASGPDLSFLRLRTKPGLPQPVVLGTAAASGDGVAAIGYTSREPGMPPEVEEILLAIFGTIYDVKRLAPGRVLAAGTDQLTHDCSTQGGNSGSAVVDIESGGLVGIHFEGGLTENLAVPVEVMRQRLDALV